MVVMNDARLLSDEELAALRMRAKDAQWDQDHLESNHGVLGWPAHYSKDVDDLRDHIDAQAERIRELEAERLMWSSELPTVPGWYWHRPRPGMGTAIRYLRYWEDDHGPLYVDGGTSLEGVMANYPGSQWAGPIPAPAEPEVETKQPTTPVHPRKRHRSDIIIINGWYL